jgi:hypothetical protein
MGVSPISEAVAIGYTLLSVVHDWHNRPDRWQIRIVPMLFVVGSVLSILFPQFIH